MQINHLPDSTNFHNFVCPDIFNHWDLLPMENTDQFTLKSKSDDRYYEFSGIVGYALQYFTGQYTVSQIQAICQEQFLDINDNQWLQKLLRKLIVLGVIKFEIENPENSQISEEQLSPKLKSVVHWLPDMVQQKWRLRNPEDVTYLQVSSYHQAVISDLGKLSLHQIAAKHGISIKEIEYLLEILTAKGMLEGTTKAKPPQKKWTPLKLIYFDFPLCNPDLWLNNHVDKVQFIFTKTFAFLLTQFITVAILVNIHEYPEIRAAGKIIWDSYNWYLIFPFALFMMFVVSLHELAHGFTLKHFGGIVPEIGMMFIFLIPGAYTITTDAYGLTKRKHQILVMAAGIICQLFIWAVAWLIWSLSSLDIGLKDSWLNVGSYVMMIAAQWTILLNLNPLNKYDGYYLLVTMTGIENLRDRSFRFYSNLSKGYPIYEQPKDKLILALYAPLSIVYTIWVISQLIFWIYGFLHSHILIVSLIIAVIILWELRANSRS
ncbi:MAG: M50 family peptidase [Nostocales cyanobacterium]|nr:MAG: M50 family peptidase [Nostocales cyanobacterium]